jgi:hypothetical protein
VTTTRAIVDAAPSREAGSVGDRRAAGLVTAAFRSRGFTTQVDRFDHEGKSLVNVIGRRAGKSQRQIVVVAARDAPGTPDAGGSAADTAALMELSRVFEGRPSRKTLVLASIDGAALGEVGAQRLLGELADPGRVDGVLVVSGLGAPTSKPALVVPWSNDTTRAGIGLQRTAAESLRQETGRTAKGASPAGQLARLAFPLGIGAQGVFIAGGYDSVRIAGGGELEDTAKSRPEDVDEDRIGSLGRATLRTLTALDQGRRPAHGPDTYVTVVSQVMPGWALSVLGLSLIIPALVASTDAFARVRRRRAPVVPWLGWLAGRFGALVLGLLLAYALAVTGAIPEPFDAPVTPSVQPLDGGAGVVLVVLLAVVAGGWLAVRRLGRLADPDLADESAPGAGVAVALVLSVAVLALWIVNPFAALLMVPALHLWILATLVDPPPPRRARMGMVAAGLALPVLLAVYYCATLSVDPVSGAWYLLLLVTGGSVGFGNALLGCLLLALLGATLAIARAGGRDVSAPRQDPPPSVRGPASYAGPGSLGGTDSALRR